VPVPAGAVAVSDVAEATVTGRGLGGELVARAEAEAVKAGYNSIYLYTHELMTENRARYRRLGYVEYERRIEDGLSRVFLRKNLAVIARLRAAGCVFAEDEVALLIEAGGDLDALVERRCAGEPLEYILGWVSFCGLRIAIDPGVFVPRQRTALLVREAVGCARPTAVVVDLCCGSGAIGAAIRASVPVELHSADIDPVAVACARRNLDSPVYEGDLFDALPSGLWGRVDVLVANVPYVPSDAIALLPPEARDHEPRVTLDGGADGLDLLRRVARGAADWLAPGGSVLIETSEGQAQVAVEIFAAAGLTARIVADDEIGATAVIGLNESATIR
jgi:release factor glutamine methyltransferase